MRAIVFAYGNVDLDGALYTCNVNISAGAAPGDYPLTISNVTLSDRSGNVVEPVIATDGKITVGPPCGDGVVDPGQECDDGNRADGDCCTADCLLVPAGTLCRGATGVCDVPEFCTGSGGACPPDG